LTGFWLEVDMARFTEAELERLKAEVSLLRLVQSQGYAPVRQGKDWLMRCPFHDDKTPSLVISEHNNLWHCLGACGVGGSVIDWVMKTQGVSFRHAVELLRNDLPGTDAAAEPKALKRSTVPKLTSPLAANADDQALLTQVVDYYHETLQQSPEALAYLEKRGLNDPALISTFKLGYANRTLAYRLPQKNRKAGADVRGALQRLGVLRESGHEHFNGSLVVPLLNAAGDVAQLYGRKILDNLRQGTAYHLYLPGDHAGVWNLDGLKNQKDVILCESLIDAMTFWCAGFRNVTTAYGVNGFTAEMLAAFQSLNIERVRIAFDRDEAGNAAAERIAKQLNDAGIAAFRVLFPKGMDANEYALKVTPAAKSLDLALRKAEWIGNGKKAASALAAGAVEAAKEEIAPEAIPSLAAAVEPSAPAVAVVDVAADVSEHEVSLQFETRHYRVRGLNKNLSHELLKINLLVREGNAFHVDTLDLYSAKARAAYIKQASQELGLAENVLKTDLGAVLLKLEELQDQLIRGVLQKNSALPAMSGADVKAAQALLKSPNLMQQVLADFARCGVVGEEANKQVAYLAAVSRKLDKPLAVMVQSSSAAGKSSLMDAVLRFMPEEERIQYSAMTGQSLFYLGEKDLRHKILAISEEEGAHNASYALKLLQSEGEVSIASTGKNAVTGNLETQEYRVEGPVMLFSTTTAIDLDEELLNRCLVLSVDESREQTQAIHAQQRKRRTLEGLRADTDKQRLIQLHQNAQRLLRPLKVVNPYAEHLTFLSDKTRARRDHEKYLALIDAIALLHQYQRDVKHENYHGSVIDYVEVTLADIALANRLAHEVLGRTLDELPPQTRKLLTLITGMVNIECQRQRIKRSDYRFSRKQVRDATGWGNTQLKVHLGRLEDMEYLALHSSARSKAIAYELRFDGETESAAPHLMGLIDVAALQKQCYDKEKSGANKTKSVQGRSPVGPVSGHGRAAGITESAEKNSLELALPENSDEIAYIRKSNGASYRSDTSSLAAGLDA
jgi:DNA primase